MTPLRAAGPSSHDEESQTLADHLQQLVAKVCFFRLLFLILLLVPLGLSWSDPESKEWMFPLLTHPEYIAFLVTGFGLTIFFLLTWRWFSDIILFFRLQLFADCALITFLVLLTGGPTSNFSFLFLGLIFLYGRILGLRTAHWLTLGIICLFLLLSGLQWSWPFLWQGAELSLRDLVYFDSVQILGLSLVLLLLKLGATQQNELVFQLARQKSNLERSEVLKTRIFDWMNSALLVLDREGKVSVVNRPALDWAGLRSNSQAIGSHVSQLFPSLAELWEEWDGKQSLRTEIEQGEKILGTTFSTLPEEQGTLILFSDITRIKELENRVKQMEKLASLGELAAGLAHELKNPLAGIKASLQLLQHDSLSEAHRDRLHQVLERDIQRLDRLVTDFLAFARPAKANRQEVKLQEVISNTIDGLQEDNPDVAIEIDPSFYERAWLWDADQLHQVLLNLLMNAIQAAREVDSPNIHISLHENESGEFISVVDNGPGIEPSLQSHIFDPFVTSKKGGSGLGLAIAQRLASQNSSWIELKNRPDKGAEARIHYQEPPAGSEAEKPESDETFDAV